MKKAVLAAALSLAVATPSLAGGYAEPVMEPEVIMEDVASSDAWVVPLMTLLVFAAALGD